jgi:hypothetical protein
MLQWAEQPGKSLVVQQQREDAGALTTVAEVVLVLSLAVLLGHTQHQVILALIRKLELAATWIVLVVLAIVISCLVAIIVVVIVPIPAIQAGKTLIIIQQMVVKLLPQFKPVQMEPLITNVLSLNRSTVLTGR